MHKGLKSSTQSQREEEAEKLKDVRKKKQKKILFNLTLTIKYFLIYHFNGYFLIWRHLIFLHELHDILQSLPYMQRSLQS